MERNERNWLPPQGARPATDPPATPGYWDPASAGEQQSPAGLGPAQPEPKSLLRRIGGILVVVALFGFKYLKLAFVALKGAKFLTTSASMLVSIGAYTLIWGWKFAVGFVVLLFIHEMGHYIQMRREGIESSPILFVPFMGAVIGAKSLGGNALAEARVGLAGPILGSIGAALCVPIALATDNDFWRALAFVGFFLNLFNLLPVVPLDGGRAMAAMSPWLWFVGLFAIVMMVFVFPNPIIILIALFAMFETYRRWKARKSGEEGNAAYYKVSPRARLAVGAVYLGLIAGLVLGMDAMFIERDFSDV